MSELEKHIPLDRRFRDLTKEEEAEPSLLSHISGWEHAEGSSWQELLKSERLVILAEAGSGKTKEMLFQVENLLRQGHIAFFIPIEELDKQGVREYLTSEPGHAERFDNWLENSADQPAWFFLDSVDELKLVQGKLERALGKMTSALGHSADHARIIVSCRPTDWQPIQDMAMFRKKLPESAEPPPTEKTKEEMFLAPIRREKEEKQEEENKPLKSRCVILLPLNKKRIEIYANARGVKNSKEFLEEIEQKEAWTFARRPLDLQYLVNMWNCSEKLGTLQQQHENSIKNSLKDNPERPDNGVLSGDKARDGVERLALAMTLTKKRTIRSPEQSTETPNPTSLDASEVLTEWTEAEVKALLRRSIFDPATYGRARFHHRSIQEYLAAGRLSRLKEQNLTKRQLNNLLFAETYGEKVVIPTMQAIAAWLSIWNQDICREVLNREPEVLVLHGDPESLSVEVRSELIKNYVTAYSQGGWRGLKMPIGEVQRLAHTDLASDIHTYLEKRHENEEVTEFLLKLVWLGGIQDCAGDAYNAAMDESLGTYSRTLAIKALYACDKSNLLRAIAQDILANEDRWEGKIIHSVIEELYPSIISTGELGRLISRTPEPTNTTGGFSWSLYNMLRTPIGSDALNIEFTDLLTNLIWDGREKSTWYSPSSSFGYLSASLARHCKQQIEKNSSIPSALIRPCVIANRFHGDHYSGRDELKYIRGEFLKESSIREATFWTELETVDAISCDERSSHRMYHALHNGLINNFQDDDLNWLLTGLNNKNQPENREVALHGLISLWSSMGRSDSYLKTLEKEVENEPELREVLAERSQPISTSPEDQIWERENQKRIKKQKKEQQEIEKSWLGWKAEAENDPDKIFKGKIGVQSMWTLMRWLRFADNNTGSLTRKNWPHIRQIMGDKIGDLFESRLKAYWREQTPPIWSRRDTEQRNKIFLSQYAGLTGLHIESSNPMWMENLSNKEITRAAEWGLVDLNGMPDWFSNLAEKYPDVVTQVLKTELEAELTGKDTVKYPHTLNSIEYGSETLKTLVTPYLKGLVCQWPQGILEENRTKKNIHLQAILSIIISVNSNDENIASLCEDRFLNSPNDSAASIWLNGLCACDLKKGLKAFRVGLEAVPKKEKQARTVEWFGRIFNDKSHDTIYVDVESDTHTLVSLTELAYQEIKVKDDIHHEGAYSPGDRDYAERARNKIFNTLIDKSGEEVHDALIQISDKPLFSHMSDRIKVLAKQRAAKDSDLKIFSIEEYREWEEKYELKPQNRDDLFEIMMGRLDDIEHDILHHDFTERQTLIKIKYEAEMQPILARKMLDSARGYYEVVRENEAADKNKADISLVAGKAGRVVIEIKIGDNDYSVRDLENSIETQLVGQYLRHDNCTAGALLVTYAGRKNFQNTETKQPMTFDEVIEHLQNFANDIETKEHGRVRLAVKGLDLRKPIS